MKKAFITGITGQDGSYLAEFLLSKGYEVHGLIRRASTFNTERIEHIYQDPHVGNQKLFLHYGDLSEGSSITNLLLKIKPDEIYNLGAQSHVRVSFDIPAYTTNINNQGAVHILETIRSLNLKTKYYQAGSSEMFGQVRETPQTEKTPFYPRSPYACSKVFCHYLTVNYRESYNLFACNGILFNHESPRRGETFVTRKITRGIARIKLGLDQKLYLGNLNAKRDWGFAGDYIEAMWLMLQQEISEDFVIATGKNYAVRDFLLKTCEVAGIKIKSNGKSGIDEKFYDEESGKILIEIDPRYFRPVEVDVLLGNSQKARAKLKWSPKTNFDSLIKMMYESDYQRESGLQKQYSPFFI